MKMVFKCESDNIKKFFDNVVDLMESISLQRDNQNDIKNVFSDFSVIVLDTTGLYLLLKNVSDDKMIIEANNIRALECSFYVASETQEVDEITVDPDKLLETYKKEVDGLLDTLGLKELYIGEDMVMDGENCTYTLKLAIDPINIDYCMMKLHEYIKYDLVWS